jgi:fructosamine-3-kinase
MDQALRDHLSSFVGAPIKHCVAVSGGDIAQAFRIQTATDRFFCKLLQNPGALAMLESEADGLNSIMSTKTVRTPKLYFCDSWENGAVLLMEYIESKRPSSEEMAGFGRQLAQLHQSSSAFYGWGSDNFIGSLPQSNKNHGSWSDFYVEERLMPQLKIAGDSGLLEDRDIPAENRLHKVLEELSLGVRPSLLHGDLWAGNYLIDINGEPVLIDPAVYNGHNEVDLAMSHLFGGFDNSFYRAYEEVFPGDPLTADRLKIYQLYYLLVHLNLFGRSYYSGVKAILKSYF